MLQLLIHAFQGSEITEFTFSDKTTKINNGLFANCKSLASITLPETITSIGKSAFSGCSGLTEITIPKNVESIGDYAFEGTPITKIFIPKSVQSFGIYTFFDCKYLKEAEFEQGVDNIGVGIFAHCYSLEKVTLPFAAGSSKELTPSKEFDTISITSLRTILGSQYGNSEYLTDYIPKTLKTIVITEGDRIPADAFNGLSTVKEIVLPDTITKIEANAFNGCSGLETIVFSENIESIASNAFNSAKVKNVYFYNKEVAIPAIPAGTTIYGYYRSTADVYAYEHGLDFVPLDELMLGDANYDALIDMKDVIAIREYLANGESERIALDAADIDGDGEITLKDVALLREAIANETEL